MAEMTPMMGQYLKIKSQYKQCLLFYRLGDFYEMFFDDALIAAKALELTLTKRSYGNGQKADMCGVPYHAADTYIGRLIEKGFKVAICEQMEDAKAVKGIVKREVIRVITPGTVTDALSLDETSNNYICAIYNDKLEYGIAFADITTGEFQATTVGVINAADNILDELAKLKPSEVICKSSFKQDKVCQKIQERLLDFHPYCFDDWGFDYESASKKLLSHFGVLTMDGFGLRDKRAAICAAGGLLNYLAETQKNDLSQIIDIGYYETSDYMMLDASSRKNLEITESMSSRNKKSCLYWTLNYTKTSMGARLLRRYLEQPLTDCKQINQRLSAVSEFKENILLRGSIRKALEEIYDIERLITKFIYRSANARDMVALKNSVAHLPEIKAQLEETKSSYFQVIAMELDPLQDLYEQIARTIVEEPPVAITEGGMVRSGYSEELDALLSARTDGAKWLEELTQREIEATGIKNLKIKNNRVFGYYIEVTKSHIHLVPERFIRRQTLGNCERYTTQELRALEGKVVGAAERLYTLEYEIFCALREEIINNAKRVQKTAQIIALLDVVQSLAEAADKNGYCRPEITDAPVIEIKAGRHPVVERATEDAFVPNDTFLDDEENRLAIITGPNMAGKSTYMRQTAIIVLMAQVGSFVPAEACKISPVDKIFTRVGASDDLAAGQSTFMVEMTEVANILNNATGNSLIILDEIGRGTSTFDGLSIAWAVLEYISDKRQLGAKTLFATHYHELTELEGKIPGVKNYCFTVKEEGSDVIFRRKIQRGGAESSLGVVVARLAGVPLKVVKRSEQILKQLNDADITKKGKNIARQALKEAKETTVQPDLFTVKNDVLIDKIKAYDVTNMTPIETMQALFDLQKDIRGM